MLIHEESAGRIHGIQIGRGVPLISHILFVDDLLYFPALLGSKRKLFGLTYKNMGAGRGSV